MTPQQAALIAQGAHRKVGGQWTYCHITAEELADLADAYLNLETQRAQIATLMPAVLQLWAENGREEERRLLGEIGELVKLPIDKEGDP